MPYGPGTYPQGDPRNDPSHPVNRGGGGGGRQMANPWLSSMGSLLERSRMGAKLPQGDDRSPFSGGFTSGPFYGPGSAPNRQSSGPSMSGGGNGRSPVLRDPRPQGGHSFGGGGGGRPQGSGGGSGYGGPGPGPHIPNRQSSGPLQMPSEQPFQGRFKSPAPPPMSGMPAWNPTGNVINAGLGKYGALGPGFMSPGFQPKFDPYASGSPFAAGLSNSPLFQGMDLAQLMNLRNTGDGGLMFRRPQSM